MPFKSEVSPSPSLERPGLFHEKTFLDCSLKVNREIVIRNVLWLDSFSTLVASTDKQGASCYRQVHLFVNSKYFKSNASAYWLYVVNQQQDFQLTIKINRFSSTTNNCLALNWLGMTALEAVLFSYWSVQALNILEPFCHFFMEHGKLRAWKLKNNCFLFARRLLPFKLWMQMLSCVQSTVQTLRALRKISLLKSWRDGKKIDFCV